DDIGPSAGQIADRGLGALDAVDVDVVLLEDTREEKTRRPRIVDDQRPLLRHARESYMRCAQRATVFAGSTTERYNSERRPACHGGRRPGARVRPSLLREGTCQTGLWSICGSADCRGKASA